MATSASVPWRPKRNLRRDCLFLIVGEYIGHGRGDVAGSDGVDGDVAGGELARHGERKADKSSLGRGIVCLSRRAHLANDGSDVDDASPALLHHAADDGLGQQKGCAQVGGQDVIPVGTLHSQQQGVAGDPGVVDQDVDFSELGGDLL